MTFVSCQIILNNMYIQSLLNIMITILSHKYRDLIKVSFQLRKFNVICNIKHDIYIYLG